MGRAVVVGLRRNDGAYLWQHRDNGTSHHPNRKSLITGSVDEGEESTRQTAVREVFEESGYIATEDELIHVGEMEGRDVYLLHYNSEQEIICKEGTTLEFIHPSKASGPEFVGDQLICALKMEESLYSRRIERIPA